MLAGTIGHAPNAEFGKRRSRTHRGMAFFGRPSLASGRSDLGWAETAGPASRQPVAGYGEMSTGQKLRECVAWRGGGMLRLFRSTHPSIVSK